MTLDTDAYHKVLQARAGLVLDHPFFGHLALRLRLKEDPTCDTAWSDGRSLAYNPHYISILSREKVKGLMGHVVMHPACRHHLRRQQRDAGVWNMACDYAINWILLEAGLSLPEGFLDKVAWRGKTADEIYGLLMDERHGNPADGDRQQDQKRDPAEGEPVDLPEDAQGSKGKSDAGEPDDDDTATDAADGDEEQADDPDPPANSQGDPGRAGEVRDAPSAEEGGGGLGDETPEESQWRINLAQAAARARSVGDLPAGLARLVESLLAPKLDWRQLLHRFIQAAARCDYAWMPPNRRYLHQGLYLPSMRSSDLPDVVVAVDTSGSIADNELSQFAAELSVILEDCAQTIHLLYCDMKVNRALTVQRQDLPLHLEAEGGGGTDFRPAFDWVQQRGISPLCMVYLTDLAGNHFPTPPPYPVLWACVGETGETPPFGESVAIN